MKYLLFLYFLILSCKTPEYSGITSDGKIIFYNGERIAELEQIEYEHYRGKRVVEISIKQDSPGLTKETQKIVDYILSKYPDAKVEVKPKM